MNVCMSRNMSEIREDNPRAFDESYIERIEDAVDIHVDKMTLAELLEYTAYNMKDYYVNVAPDEEVDEFLKQYEQLPF